MTARMDACMHACMHGQTKWMNVRHTAVSSTSHNSFYGSSIYFHFSRRWHSAPHYVPPLTYTIQSDDDVIFSKQQSIKGRRRQQTNMTYTSIVIKQDSDAETYRQTAAYTPRR
jgi:hypothetical protein